MKNQIFEHAEIKYVSAVMPRNSINISELKSKYGEKLVNRIMESTGVTEVSVSPIDQTSSDLCVASAKHLLEQSNISPDAIDGLIYITEMPDHIAPTTAASLQDRLKLPKTTIVYEIHLSCSGYVYGLFQAAMMIECGYCKNVLLLVGTTMTRYINEEDRALRMISGDAASATLLTTTEKNKQMRFCFYSDGSQYKSLILPAGGLRIPIQKGVTDVLCYDEDGNGRTQEDIYMDGMGIMVFSTIIVPKLIKKLIANLDIKIDDIDVLLLHQANKMIVERIAKVLKLPPDKVPLGLAKTGNTGLTSIPLMMCNKYPGVNKELKRAILCGFGSGVVAAACSADISETMFFNTIRV